jgi:hypothetical protein
VKRKNSYRDPIVGNHPYSHLKSFKAELFLQTRAESYQDKQGKWYTNNADNAYMYAMLELSCGRVEYIPEITYKYNVGTGYNDELIPQKILT